MTILKQIMKYFMEFLETRYEYQAISDYFTFVLLSS